MRFFLLIFFSGITVLLYSQHTKINTDSLPEIRPSFFTEKNTHNCYFFMAEHNSYSGNYFFADNDSSALKFIRQSAAKKPNKLVTDTGLAADSVYRGIRFSLLKSPSGILLDGVGTRPVLFANWKIIDSNYNDCNGMPIFPHVILTAQYPNDKNKAAPVIPGFICNGKIHFESSGNKITAANEYSVNENLQRKISVIDMNNDQVSDIYTIQEYDTSQWPLSRYQVYLNISGKWILKFYAENPDCI